MGRVNVRTDGRSLPAPPGPTAADIKPPLVELGEESLRNRQIHTP